MRNSIRTPLRHLLPEKLPAFWRASFRTNTERPHGGSPINPDVRSRVTPHARDASSMNYVGAYARSRPTTCLPRAHAPPFAPSVMESTAGFRDVSPSSIAGVLRAARQADARAHIGARYYLFPDDTAEMGWRPRRRGIVKRRILPWRRGSPLVYLVCKLTYA